MHMPRIIVEAGEDESPTVTLHEWIVPSQMESDWFSAQLLERVTWAVNDAAELEREPAPQRR